MKYKISIITINYNNRLGLEKTINSVIQQTLSHFEFLVIDGNSTDGSKEIIECHKHRIDFLVSEPDNGIYHAMNKGIRAAKGEFLLFLNSGDILHNHQVLDLLSPELNEHHDIYYGDIMYDEISKKTKRTFPDQLSFAYFFEHNLSHQASLIRKTLFDQIFYYNEQYKIVSDWEFFICAICKYNVSYQHLDQVIVDYDATGLSSNLDNHPMMHKERELTLSKYFPLFLEDYRNIHELNSKRIRQVLYIKNHRFAWTIMKGFMNIVLLFLPKFKK